MAEAAGVVGGGLVQEWRGRPVMIAGSIVVLHGRVVACLLGVQLQRRRHHLHNHNSMMNQ